MDEHEIIEREDILRNWFTCGADSLRKVVDGLDIGWGGVQRWATSHVPQPGDGIHVDAACGYATFLAELGWRFPWAKLVGINIDFEGPHALAPSLLGQAGVEAQLIQADARVLPFPDGSIASWSSFLGLQDVDIGFRAAGVRQTISEAVRVLRHGGVLTIIDHYSFQTLDQWLASFALDVVYRGERTPDVRWDREVAERAVSLYAEGWSEQLREVDSETRERCRSEIHQRLREDVARQLRKQGYYVPFGPVRMIAARKRLLPGAGYPS